MDLPSPKASVDYLLMCLLGCPLGSEWAYNSSQHTSIYVIVIDWESGTHVQRKISHHFFGRFLTFFLVTPDNEWIFLLLELALILWWTMSLLTQLAQIWCTEHQWRQRWLLKKKHNPTSNEHQMIISFFLLLRCMGAFMIVLIHFLLFVHRPLLHIINDFF